MINDLLVRYGDKFINGYSQFFQDQLNELDSKLKQIDRQIAFEIYEQKLKNSNLEMVKEEQSLQHDKK